MASLVLMVIALVLGGFALSWLAAYLMDWLDCAGRRRLQEQRESRRQQQLSTMTVTRILSSSDIQTSTAREVEDVESGIVEIGNYRVRENLILNNDDNSNNREKDDNKNEIEMTTINSSSKEEEEEEEGLSPESDNKNNDNSDSKLCIICCEKPRDSIFLPCAHQACCTICATKLNKCPICGCKAKPIQIFTS